MSDFGAMSEKERHEALWHEVALLRMKLADMQRRAERAESTTASMIHELKPILPSGFRGDNPVWACGKIVDRVQEMGSTIDGLRNEIGISNSVISNLQGAIEDLTEEIRNMQGVIDRQDADS